MAGLPVLQAPIVEDRDRLDFEGLAAVFFAPHDDLLVPDARLAVRFLPDVRCGVVPSWRCARWLKEWAPEEDHMPLRLFCSEVQAGDAINQAVFEQSCSGRVGWVG